MKSLILLVLLSAGCVIPVRKAPEPVGDPKSNVAVEAAPAPGRNSVVACGQYFPVAAPVVLWTEPPYYDAYKTTRRFPVGNRNPSELVPDGKLRYQPGRKDGTRLLVLPESRALEPLQGVVDQFVLHYDVAGLSSTCFKILHDIRGLSVHFLLDIDGTIYQTMDLRETGWHATKANGRSIGIEIANLGAYPVGKPSILDEWYGEDPSGVRITIPRWKKGPGVRTPGFVGRPARENRVVGIVQGQRLEQYDFTPEQYESLAALIATLCEIFPNMPPEPPRGVTGRIRPAVLSNDEFENFQGILGHFHVQENKQDPGPAFDWERVVRRAKEWMPRQR